VEDGYQNMVNNFSSLDLPDEPTSSFVNGGIFSFDLKQFNILKSKIREVPFPVASYWRSLTPAHLDCAASTTCK
jgi:hypothetical protein